MGEHMTQLRIGIDLGGTKIEGVALASDGRELTRRRIPAPAGDYAKTIEALAGLVGDLERAAGGSATVGSPAAVVNAVVDALKPYGIRHADMPLTPAEVWMTMQGKTLRTDLAFED